MKLDLTELRRVASEATQGEWEANDTGGVYLADDESCDFLYVADEATNEDAKHIATFNPQTALALLDLLDKAVGMAEFYAHSDFEDDRPVDSINDRGRRAREFLAAVKQVTDENI